MPENLGFRLYDTVKNRIVKRGGSFISGNGDVAILTAKGGLIWDTENRYRVERETGYYSKKDQPIYVGDNVVFTYNSEDTTGIIGEYHGKFYIKIIFMPHRFGTLELEGTDVKRVTGHHQDEED